VEGTPIGAEPMTGEEVLPAELARRLTIPPPTPRGSRAEQLRLVEWGISCTLSQLLVTGLMHADTHGGNLLRVDTGKVSRAGVLSSPHLLPPPFGGCVKRESPPRTPNAGGEA
jgi:hypothetical protein